MTETAHHNRTARRDTARQLVTVETKQSVVGTRTLEELAQSINDSNERVKEGLAASLRAAIDAGEDLLEAQRKLPPSGFSRWLAENVNINQTAAMTYMRLAEFQNHLPPEFTDPTIERRSDGKIVSTGTIEKALVYLTAVGAKRTPTSQRRTDYEEITRLLASGMKAKHVAAVLGVSEATVYLAKKTPKELQAYRARNKASARARARALRLQAQSDAIRATKGDVSSAYALVRRSLQHLQSAHDAMPSGSKSRRTLQGAMTHLHEAEDAIGRAVIDAGADVSVLTS